VPILNQLRASMELVDVIKLSEKACDFDDLFVH
jgi:hypothetical protein